MIRFALLLVLAALAPAQKVALTDGSGRIVQVFPIGDLFPKATAAEAAEAPEPRASELARKAAFVESFVSPRLAPGESVAALGEDYLVVLAEPEHAARIERLLATMRAKTDVDIAVESRIHYVPRDVFDTKVAASLAAIDPTKPPQANGWQKQKLFARSEAKQVAELIECLEKEGSLLTAPKLLVRPLSRATMSVGKNVRYVRDYEIEPQALGRPLVAEPVLGDAFEGIQAEVLAAPVGERQIAVQWSLLIQNVDRPIAKFKTTLGTGQPIEVDLPRTTGVRMRQSAVIEDGGTLVLAAPKTTDAEWIVVIVQVSSAKR